MIDLSRDPKVAERQMQALIFALTTFGHIDGDFDASEREVVKATIRKLVEQRVDGAMKDSDAASKKDVVDRFTGHFHEVFENIDRFVSDVMTEPVAAHDERDAVVHAKLKLRCFELFSTFDSKGRDALLDAIDQLIAADGHVHPAEAKFRAELAQLLASPDAVDTDDLVEEDDGGGDAGASRVHDVGALLAMAPGEVTVSPVVDERAQGGHQFLQPLDDDSEANPERIQKQVQADLALAEKAIA
ncbi:MAG: hypothetical protein K1X94_30765, partial [Sandaracinaceae bacterium]|nr:hypothetical protein [Sandaracinaceae bacterium]